jgi:hypothetical protein
MSKFHYQNDSTYHYPQKIKNIVYIRKRGVRVERDGRVSGSVRTLTL